MNIKKVLVSTLGTVAVLGAGFFANTTSANADVRVTVKSGDTVAKIANQYKSSVSAIEKANSLKNVNLIYVGESLTIPDSTTSTTTAATTSNSATTGSTQATNNYSSQKSTGTNASSGQSASTSTATSAATSGATSSAKSWIANKESGGSYTASNGNYYGKYQLTKSLLNGNYSAANQEKVANNYVTSRYGSWAAAKSFWQANGWY